MLDYFLPPYAVDQIVFGLLGLLAGFVLGFIVGWVAKKTAGCKYPPGLNKVHGEKQRKYFVFVVNVTIFILWTASVGNMIFQFNDSVTPWFLHAMMGAVMGYLNESFGEWLLKIIGKHTPTKNS